MTIESELILHPGERVIAKVSNCGLVEERRGPSTWAGGSAGISVPLGRVGKFPIRWRLGRTRGHHVAGTPHPESVDVGTMFITNRRVEFIGTHETREVPFTKLAAVEPGTGQSTFHVSGREYPVTLHYGPALDQWVAVRLNSALRKG